MSTIQVRSKDWLQFLSNRMKYLIIAIFLAGANPKDSDSMKFIGDQSKRRKRVLRDSDDHNNANSRGGNSSSQNITARRKLDCIQYFTLERLLSIYAQVVGIIIGKSAYDYGDMSLYANVSNVWNTFFNISLYMPRL